MGLLIAFPLAIAVAATSVQAQVTKPISALLKSAEQGDIVAQRRLGQAFELGQGVPMDIDAAELWYGKAASSGDVDAMGNYGRLLFAKNQTTGIPWLIKAAERGDAKAAYIAGIALFNGDGGPKNWPAAFVYLTLAVEGGQVSARPSLARVTSLLSAEQRDQGASRLRALKLQLATQQAAPPSRPSADRPVRPSAAAVSPAKASPAKPNPAKPVAARNGGQPAQGAVQAGEHYVQLGAFSDEAKARSAWKDLESRVRPLAGGRRPSFIPAGKIVRLRLQNIDQTSANRLCQTMTVARKPCFVGRQPGKIPS
ncbi:hypothetical protein M2333_000239 [Sphingobium sp. B11D3B]|uniref:SPOR domain-containing protein n=1 Tax=Sphingobium sp. B11D3B TaxID=2940575 RepID=UPI0022265262|nr:SPOR domain-containing protein [Sphingobium sp. B11D3B]MCW2387193.1 hypothetical protein [Sphingobium sp. B11D3B]